MLWVWLQLAFAAAKAKPNDNIAAKTSRNEGEGGGGILPRVSPIGSGASDDAKLCSRKPPENDYDDMRDACSCSSFFESPAPN